ncbi:MAG: hypothetical protein CMJ52_06930 [Planctomycetaceae bacterium]|nr:hypothetical protein [Planctomycetaceae bacterium]
MKDLPERHLVRRSDGIPVPVRRSPRGMMTAWSATDPMERSRRTPGRPSTADDRASRIVLEAVPEEARSGARSEP